jgi:hypothetical protein
MHAHQQKLQAYCPACPPIFAAADGTSHGVFFLNSNGMDVYLNKSSITYKYAGDLIIYLQGS